MWYQIIHAMLVKRCVEAVLQEHTALFLSNKIMPLNDYSLHLLTFWVFLLRNKFFFVLLLTYLVKNTVCIDQTKSF